MKIVVQDIVSRAHFILKTFNGQVFPHNENRTKRKPVKYAAVSLPELQKVLPLWAGPLIRKNSL